MSVSGFRLMTRTVLRNHVNGLPETVIQGEPRAWTAAFGVAGVPTAGEGGEGRPSFRQPGGCSVMDWL